MRTLLTALAGAALLVSTGALAQGMNNGAKGNAGSRGDHPVGHMDHPANNGDREHVGMDHTNNQGVVHTDNRVVHRDSRMMRHHGRARNSRHARCWTTWRNHRRIRVCR